MALLFYYRKDLVEVSVVHDYDVELQMILKPFSLPGARGFFVAMD